MGMVGVPVGVVVPVGAGLGLVGKASAMAASILE